MAGHLDEEAARNTSEANSTAEPTSLETDSLPLDDLSEDSSPPTPRFLQDQRNRYIKRVPVPIRRVSKAAWKWMKGPQPPRVHAIKPVFPSIQEFPIRLLDRFFPKRRHRVLLLLGYYFFWILAFVLVKHKSTIATEVEGFGRPSSIGCGYSNWAPGNSCGVNGNDCRPFNGTGFAFRCPSNCKNHHVLNPRAVGSFEAIYQPLVIGGPSDDDERPIYRSDSFVCGAAIHAGIIDNNNGGCGVVALIGAHRKYQSSKRNGIESIGFDSDFPSSFAFYPTVNCEATDARWQLLYISVIFSAVFSLFTTSGPIFFFTIFVVTFVHVGLASDPPLTNSTVAALVSNLLGKFLPSMFIAIVMYRYMGVRRTLTGLTAQIEKTVLWLGACWVGALTNYTLDFIPIQRLNKHDLDQQPGARAALAFIIIVLASIFAQQIWYFRQEGRLIRYLGIYGILIASILISLAIPALNLRIHHYILALLLLPGTSMQTRPVLLYQGLLIGLFVNGIARWGFDPVLQTSGSLQGDAQYDSSLPITRSPDITLGQNASSISFSWIDPPEPFDGISVLVNDVERFRGYTDEGLPSDKQFVWTQSPNIVDPQYFRFAYMQGSQSWDYTRAGVWSPNGAWVPMPPGPSRVKSRSLERDFLS